MFCPSCGFEDKQANQFCRACGSNLSIVRVALEKPDNITESATFARTEIGNAIAMKIRETHSASELKKVAEDVLPEIEKFLESPAEKRMRRIRMGTTISLIGLGAAIAFTIISTMVKDEGLMVIAGLGVICLFIGLSFFINGLLFTVPKKTISDNSTEADTQRQLDAAETTNDLVLPPATQTFASVTEHTTHQLKQKTPIPRS